jgi:hypothetical protein
MATDSRRTTTITQIEPIGERRVKYDETNKLFQVEGIGVVTMWGDFTHVEKAVAPHLESAAAGLSGPDDLATNLLEFLKSNVHQNSDHDVGFHVGGYRANGTKALYHVFYGVDRGPYIDASNNPQGFKKYDHSNFLALYNGNNAIAHAFINLMFHLERLGFLKWVTEHPLEKASEFAGLFVRYASAFDPSIGGDVQVATITPNNIVRLCIHRADSLSFSQPMLSEVGDFSSLSSGIWMLNTGTPPTGSVP